MARSVLSEESGLGILWDPWGNDGASLEGGEPSMLGSKASHVDWKSFPLAGVDDEFSNWVWWPPGDENVSVEVWNVKPGDKNSVTLGVVVQPTM